MYRADKRSNNSLDSISRYNMPKANTAGKRGGFELLPNQGLPAEKSAMPASQKPKQKNQMPVVNSPASSNSRSSRKKRRYKSQPKAPQIKLLQRSDRITDNMPPQTSTLYGDQRARKRSVSKESHEIQSSQHFAAFGQGTIIENEGFNESDKLRGRVSDDEKLRKDVESLQKSMNALLMKDAVMERCLKDNEQLRGDLKSLRFKFEALSTQTGTLAKRITELEFQGQSPKSQPIKRLPSTSTQNYTKQQTGLDNLMKYSIVNPIPDEPALKKKNEAQINGNRARHSDFFELPYNRNDYNQKKSQVVAQMGKKELPSTSVFDVDETCDEDEDGFRFVDD